MKKLLILLAIVFAFSACRKGSGTNNNLACWQCAIEGNYNGTLVDIDTTICNKSKAGIDEFMAPHNGTEQVVTCERMLDE